MGDIKNTLLFIQKTFWPTGVLAIMTFADIEIIVKILIGLGSLILLYYQIKKAYYEDKQRNKKL